MNVLEQPLMLWGLLAIPLAYLLWRYLNFRRRGRLRKSIAPSQWRTLTGTLWQKARVWRLRLVLIAIFLAVVAAAGPQYGTELLDVQRMGADLVVAIDVSGSMMAEDFRPNRLEAAKRAVHTLIAGLKGDRVGLVSFAGAAAIMCPLTSDYHAFDLFLKLATPNYIPRPGTNIGDALQLSARLLKSEQDRDRAVILITDGEDHGGTIEDELSALIDEGAKVYAVGIGSPEGTLIPEYDDAGVVTGYKKDRSGNLVKTRLDAATLQSIAEQTGGKFFQVDPEGRSMEDILIEIGALQKGAYAERAMYRYKNRYLWPLAGAILALFGFIIAWERKGEVKI